ncbi:MAG: hypothetical protein H2212_10745 [Ruminococcus sp.]|nr:hypothetical protein [Ruminococcus sp.]
MESYSAEAILSAVDKSGISKMANTLGGIDKILKVNDLSKIEGAFTKILEAVEGSSKQVEDFLSFFAGADTAEKQLALITDTIKTMVPSLNNLTLEKILPVVSKVSKGMGAMTTLIQSSVEKFTGVYKSGIEKLASVSKAGIDKTIAAFKKLPAGVHGAVEKVQLKMMDILPESVYDKIDGVAGKIGGKFSDLGSKITAPVGKMVENVQLKMMDILPESVYDKIDGAAGKVGGMFSALGSGIGNGLKKSAGVGMQALSTMVKGLMSVFQLALAVIGPAAILGLVVIGLGAVYQQFGSQIDSMIQIVTTKGPEIINNLVSGITSSIPALAESGAKLLNMLMMTISALLPTVVQAGMNILTAVVQGVTSNMDILLQGAITLVTTLINQIISLVPQLLICGLGILMSLVDGILSNMNLLLESVVSIINTFSEQMTANLPTILNMGLEILQKLAEGIVQALPVLIVAALEAMTGFVTGLANSLPTVLGSAVMIVTTLVEGLINNLPQILNAAVQFIVEIVKGIITSLPQVLNAGVQIIAQLVTGLIQSIPMIISAAGNLVSGVIDTIKGTDWLSIGLNIISGIANGISSAAGALWEAASGVLGGFKDKVLGYFGIHSPSRWGIWVGKMLDVGIAGGIDKSMSKVVNAASSLTGTVMKEIEYLQDYGNNAIDFNGIVSSGTVAIGATLNARDAELFSNGAAFTQKTRYVFEVPVNLDGREVGYGTAEYVEEKNERMTKLKKQMKGIR